MADVRINDLPSAASWNGFFPQDKPGGPTECVSVATVEAKLVEDGFVKTAMLVAGYQPLENQRLRTTDSPTFAGLLLSGATANKLARFNASKNLVAYDLVAADIPALDASKINAGTFADTRIASAPTWNAKLGPLNVSGYANEVAAFVGANTVTGDQGLKRYRTGDITTQLGIGTNTAVDASFVAQSQVGGTSAFRHYQGHALRFQSILRTDGSWALQAHNTYDALIDAPIAVINGSGGIVSIGGAGRPVNLTTGSKLQVNGSDAITSARVGDLASLKIAGVERITAAGGFVGTSLQISSATASTMAKWDGSKNLISAVAGTDFLAPSNVSGTAGQVAAFSGTNTVASDAGLVRVQSGGKTYQLIIGDGTATSSSSLILKNPTANSSMLEIWEGAFKRFQFGRSGTNIAMSAYTTGGGGIDDPIVMALASGGAITLGGTTSRPVNIKYNLQIAGADAITSARAGDLTALKVGASTGFVRSAGGTYSASPLIAADIPALNYHPLENQRLSTGYSPTFVSVSATNMRMEAYSGVAAGWLGYPGFNLGAATGAGFWAWSDGGVGIDVAPTKTLSARVAGSNVWTMAGSGNTLAGTTTLSGLTGTTTRLATINAAGVLGVASPGVDFPRFPISKTVLVKRGTGNQTLYTRNFSANEMNVLGKTIKVIFYATALSPAQGDFEVLFGNMSLGHCGIIPGVIAKFEFVFSVETIGTGGKFCTAMVNSTNNGSVGSGSDWGAGVNLTIAQTFSVNFSQTVAGTVIINQMSVEIIEP